MPNNYVLLEKITVGSAGASSVTFNNIPQTGYTDLVVRMSTRSAAAVNGSAYGMGMTINGVGTNRTFRRLEAWDGTNIGSDTNTNDMTAIIQGNSTTASTFNNVQIYFSNYTSNNNKTFSVEGVNENASTTGNDIYLLAGLWAQTAAITSLAFYDRNGSSNFLANSTFKLYGVAKLNTTPAIAPKATGGDTIMTDGTYWYHAFTSSGTFTPATVLSCAVLVVAGGGSGAGTYGNQSSGGGGAGGFQTFSTQSVSTAQTVTVGAGGAAVNTSSITFGNAGSNSQFGSLTASVGGGRGGAAAGAASVGGSGGGAGNQTFPTGAAGTSGQGFAGGNGGGVNEGAGGGGGASAVGANNSTVNGGNGGAGTASSLSGSSVTYSGGGGGSSGSTGTQGQGGAGGGGAAGSGAAGTNGTANRGGGGGGCYGNTPANLSGAGGSGIVIVRYSV
jgi:hypothetical protein